MWKNNLRIGIRKLQRNKTYSIINILGLGVGMGVCLLICQYIFFEFSYDRFHSNADRIYRVTQTKHEKGELVSFSPYTTSGLGENSLETVPEIEDVLRIVPAEIGLVVMNRDAQKSNLEEKIFFTDPTFLDLFDFPLKYGDKGSIFKEKHEIVISEETAQKYFGDINPIGKSLETSGGVLSGNFKVTGVLVSLPENTHLQFDILLPLNFLTENYGKYKGDEGWDWDDFVTYIKFQETVNPDLATTKLQEIVATKIGQELSQNNEHWDLTLQNLSDIHLQSHFTRNFESNNGNASNLQYFLIIALFILLMAWVNYVNLSTAQAISRVKEVGIRKTIGAKKGELIRQFLAETLIVNCIAAILALFIAYALLPILKQLVGKEIEFTLLLDHRFWLGYGLIVLLGSVLSGLYPAFVLTTFKPINLLSKVSLTTSPRWNLRSGLLIFQFMVSILLIAATFLVYHQVSFMKSQELGMDSEEVLVIEGPRVIIESVIQKGESLADHYQTFKNETATNSSIRGVTASSSVPGKDYFWEGTIGRPEMPEHRSVVSKATIVDRDFFDTYGVEMLVKPELPQSIPDWSYTYINETALDELGFTSAEEALGKEVNFVGYTLNIMGVVKNFHWHSPKAALAPTLYILDDAYGAYFSVKMNLSEIEETIAHLKGNFEKVFPNDPFSYYFLDDQFNQQYQADLQFGNLFTSFSILAILIACLGLFSMVSFTVYSRAKEIGVRKVLGANSKSLVLIFMKDYVYLICIAAILSLPIIYFYGDSWLQNFAYRVEIGPLSLIAPAVLLIVIGTVTIMTKIYSAVKENPINALRSE